MNDEDVQMAIQGDRYGPIIINIKNDPMSKPPTRPGPPPPTVPKKKADVQALMKMWEAFGGVSLDDMIKNFVQEREAEDASKTGAERLREQMGDDENFILPG